MYKKAPIIKQGRPTGGCKAPEEPKAIPIKSNKEKSELLKQYFKSKSNN